MTLLSGNQTGALCERSVKTLCRFKDMSNNELLFAFEFTHNMHTVPRGADAAGGSNRRRFPWVVCESTASRSTR